MRDLLADGARCRRPGLERAEAGSTAGSAARACSPARACSAASASSFPAASAGGACRRCAFGAHRRAARGPQTCRVEDAAQARRSARGEEEGGARGETCGETCGSCSAGTNRREQERRLFRPGIGDVEGAAVPPRRAPRGSPAVGYGSHSGPRRPLARLACARRSPAGARAPRRLGPGRDRLLLPAGDDVLDVTR